MRVTRWLPVVLLGVGLAGLAYAMLWTTMMAYDDEGYVLYSLKTFVKEGALYEKVFSQYGPFFFLWNWLLSLVGFDFSNTGARVITLVYWMVTICACGSIVARATRSAVASAVTMAVVFLHLWTMVSEPSHPGGLICAVVAFVAWMGSLDRVSARKRAFAIGTAATALVLIKINVGVFLLAGATAWWVIASKECGDKRWWRALAAAALVALPALVMHQFVFSERWVFTFVLVTASAAAATVLTTPRIAGPLPIGALSTGVIAGVVLALGTFAFILATGTTLAGLIDGVILGPLRHPGAFSIPVGWRPGAITVAAVSMVAVLLSTLVAAERRLPWVLSFRLLAAGAYLLCWNNVIAVDMHAFSISYGLSAIGWFVIPLRSSDSTIGVRSWLGLLTATQALHAYPVAGSQLSWGTFLWLPLAAIAVHDGVAALQERYAPQRRPWLSLAVGAAATLLVAIHLGGFARITAKRFENSDMLELPGAATTFLPHSFTSALRVLSLNAAIHADPLFSMPGMLSFHHWSGVDAPTTHNTTHWFTLLPADRQEAIRQKMEASPRSCVIVQRGVYDFLVRTGVQTESSLTQWLHANFETAFAFETYEFWVRRGRTIAKVGTAEAREASGENLPRYRVQITLADARATNVAQVVLQQFYGDGVQDMQRWDAQNSRVQLTPLNSAGLPRSKSFDASWPFDAAELMRVEIFTDEFPKALNPDRIVIRLRDTAGNVVGEARLLN